MTGLSAAHLAEIETIFRSILGRSPVKVFLFGSRARGDCRRYSDADILIEGEAPPAPLRELKAALADSGLPFKCDVVLERDVYQDYRVQIQSEKKLLFELSGPDAEPAPAPKIKKTKGL